MPLAYPFRWPTGPDNAGAEALAQVISKIDKEIGAHNVAAIVIEPIAGEGGFIVPAPRASCPALPRTPLSRASCSWPTRCRPASPAPARCSPARTRASCPTSSPPPRASPAGCRSRPSPAAPRSWTRSTPAASAAPTAATRSPAPPRSARSRPSRSRTSSAPPSASARSCSRRCRRWRRRYPFIGDVRGRGAMVAVELVEPGTLDPAADVTAAIAKACHAEGVLVLTAGTYGNVLRFLPPLVMPEHLLTDALGVLDKAFASVEDLTPSLPGSAASPARTAARTVRSDSPPSVGLRSGAVRMGVDRRLLSRTASPRDGTGLQHQGERVTRARGRRTAPCAAVVAVALVGVGCLGPTPVAAAVTADLVGTVPSAATPHVLDDGSGTASVQAIATVGSKVVLGGTFTHVSNAGGPTLAASEPRDLRLRHRPHHVPAHRERHGHHAPPGPKTGTVLLGGKFTRSTSTKVSNLALLNVNTGKVVTSSSRPRSTTGSTTSRWWATTCSSAESSAPWAASPRTPWCPCPPTTGKDDGWVSITFAGHHNWRGTTPDRREGLRRHREDGDQPGRDAAGGRRQLHHRRWPAARPDGRHRPHRRHARRSTLGHHEPQLHLQPQEVGQLGPRRGGLADGTYAVVVSTGGPNAGTLCDGGRAVRTQHPLARRHPDLGHVHRRRHADLRGLGPTVVYVGGHMRWMNNCHGQQQRRRRRRAAALARRARPRHRAALLLEPRAPPARPRGLGPPAHVDRPVHRQRHRLPRQRGLPAAADRVPAAEHRLGAPLAPPPPAAPDVYRAGGTDLAAGDAPAPARRGRGRRLRLADARCPQQRRLVRRSVAPSPSADQLWTAMADGSLVRPDVRRRDPRRRRSRRSRGTTRCGRTSRPARTSARPTSERRPSLATELPTSPP